MKKILVLFVVIGTLFMLSACGTQIPKDASIAVCPAGDTFKYVFDDNTVYEFYTNDVLMDKSTLNIVKDVVKNYDSVRDYLDATFQANGCSFSPYYSGKE